MNARTAQAAPPEVLERVAQVAHELRTPLNGIKSWTHVLETALESPDPMVLRAIEGILLGVEQQVALIEKLERWDGK